MTIWGWTGFAVVIYLAALQGVPQHLTEAAAIDGAGPWQAFRRVTLPLLSPASLFLAVWLTINALQLFDEVYLSTQGGPLNATTVLVYYLYDQAFQQFNFGYASAIAYFLFLVIIVITVIQFRVAGGSPTTGHDILPRLKAGDSSYSRPVRRQAVEVRGSPAGQPRRLPAQSRRAPPRCSWPRSRQRCRRNRRPCTRSALGSRATSASTCPHAEHRWLVNAGLIFSTRPGALSSRRRTSRPHPGPQNAPVEPGLGADVPARISVCPSPTGSCS